MAKLPSEVRDLRASARLSDRLPPVNYLARMTVESVWNMAAGRHAGEMIEERAA
jgi:hypothetical protein